MFDINLCTPLLDALPNGTSIRAIRLIMISDLLVLYAAYLIISFTLNRSINALKLEDSAGNTQTIVEKERKCKVHLCQKQQWEK